MPHSPILTARQTASASTAATATGADCGAFGATSHVNVSTTARIERLNRTVTYNRSMPKLTVDGYGTFDVPADKRLVLAIEQDAGVDILHACGGNARCTTCRVEFIDGEPSAMTVAEKERLAVRELSGVRLSCQILCDHDMTVRAISRLEGSGRPDPGKTPEPIITPPAQWV